MNTNEAGLAAQAHYLIEDRIRSTHPVVPAEHRRHRRLRRLVWL